jgi:hypothetical protein
MLTFAVLAPAADVSGKWTAQFDTQIGVQKYTYEFKVDNGKLTGKAVSENGESAIQDGKVSGDDITFVETLNFDGQPLRITYKGKIAGDEIKFTRNVADMATEELVAKRSK